MQNRNIKRRMLRWDGMIDLLISRHISNIIIYNMSVDESLTQERVLTILEEIADGNVTNSGPDTERMVTNLILTYSKDAFLDVVPLFRSDVTKVAV